MKKLKRYLETPTTRKARKAREYQMAVLRTAGTILASMAAIASLVINALIFIKVWLH